MGSVIYGQAEAYSVQTLARHQMIAKLLADMAQDMTICRLEGWDVRELPRRTRNAGPVPPEWGIEGAKTWKGARSAGAGVIA